MTNKTRKLGIGLVIVSGIFWLIIPLVHALKISAWWKTATDVILLIAAEIAFWLGTAVLGKNFCKNVCKKIKDSLRIKRTPSSVKT